jgi:hypothetical protein
MSLSCVVRARGTDHAPRQSCKATKVPERRGNVAPLDRAADGSTLGLATSKEETMAFVSWAVATAATLKGVTLGLAVGAAAAVRHQRKHDGGVR